MTGLTEGQERDYRAAAEVRERAEDLNVYLATWQDEGSERRRAALADAVQAIDDLLLAAHRLRGSLVTQGRLADDATAARVDELLGRYRQERES